MQNFMGEIECTLDAKGRLMIPARFRHLVPEDTGSMYVVSMGKERCLNLFPLREWNEIIVSKLHEMPPGPEKRNAIRYFSSRSSTLNIDKTGRVAIPAPFLAAIGSPKKVMVVGALNFMEIWSLDDYRRNAEAIDDAFRESGFEY
jgi:MraZ protein